MEKTVCVAILALYGVIMLMMCYIIIFSKDKKPRNKVRFFVVCEEGSYHKYNLQLWLGRPVWDEYHKFWKPNNQTARQLGFDVNFRQYGLNKNDFADMKDGDIREVYLDLED